MRRGRDARRRDRSPPRSLAPSLAPALEALAAEARADQARRVRDAAARAAPKIQLVVALVLVPAVMLLLSAVLVQGLSGPG